MFSLVVGPVPAATVTAGSDGLPRSALGAQHGGLAAVS